MTLESLPGVSDPVRLAIQTAVQGTQRRRRRGHSCAQEKVTVTEQGRRRRKSKLEVTAAQIANKGAGAIFASRQDGVGPGRQGGGQSKRGTSRGAAHRK